MNHELPFDSFLAILFSTLEDQDEELQKQFFTCTKEELVAAYFQGVEAATKKWPSSANPYKESNITAYSPNLAWNEGWASINMDFNKLLNL